MRFRWLALIALFPLAGCGVFKGEPVDLLVDTGAGLVTKDNMKDYM